MSGNPNTTHIKHIRAIIRKSIRRFTPPERMTVSECAERYIILPRGTTPFPGRYRAMSFQREIMDVFNDPKIDRIIVESGTQLGKTQTIINIIAWIVINDPSAILCVFPRDEDVRNFSRRLRLIIDASPELRERFSKEDKADVQNVKAMSFRGGTIYLAHAGSPASLAMNPCKYVIMDEVDKYNYELGVEGDPVKLAEARSDNYEKTGRKIIMTCSPTDSRSRIHSEFESGDKRYFQIPCPHCGELFRQTFGDVIWNKDENENPVRHITETSRVKCPMCAHEFTEAQRIRSIELGQYYRTSETRHVASFNIPSYYSPIRSLPTLVDDFLDAKKSANKYKVFVNTKLAEIHTVKSESLDPSDLYNRREPYPAKVPEGCGILLAGVDVQGDRIECATWGFGLNDEMWLIDYTPIPGNFSRPEVQVLLDEYRNQTFEHVTGAKIRIRLTAIDAGDQAKDVLDYCAKSPHNCIPVRGNPHTQLTLCQKSKRAEYPVYWVATDIAKDIIFDRLKVITPGPRYIHIPEWVTQDWCAQVTSNERREVKRAGKTTTRWEKRTANARDEGLDTLVYPLALFDITPFAKNMKSILAGIGAEPAKKEAEKEPATPQKKTRIVVKNGGIGGYMK